MASGVAYNYILEIMGEVRESVVFQQDEKSSFGNQIAKRDNQIAYGNGAFSYRPSSDRS